MVIFFLTSVGATLFYALGLSMLLIGAHAAMRVPGAAQLGGLGCTHTAGQGNVAMQAV